VVVVDRFHSLRRDIALAFAGPERNRCVAFLANRSRRLRALQLRCAQEEGARLLVSLNGKLNVEEPREAPNQAMDRVALKLDARPFDEVDDSATRRAYAAAAALNELEAGSFPQAPLD